MDVLEIDAASNRGIDEIRDLREKVKFAPTEGKFRIYIIDEVHMLTTEAFNALLKTLEEPPAHVIFVLATTEPHKIPLTILSRCQRFDFRRISVMDIAARLRTVVNDLGVETDEEAIGLIARAAEGGMRDALSVLDQCISFGGRRVALEDVNNVLGTVNTDFLFQMAEGLNNHDVTGGLKLVDTLVREGKDVRQFTKDLTEFFRNLLLIEVCQDAGELVPVSEEGLKRMRNLAPQLGRKRIMSLIEIFTSSEREMKWTSQPRLILELAVIRAGEKPFSNEYDILLDRITRIEKVVAGKGVLAADTGKPEMESDLDNDSPGILVDTQTVKECWQEILERIKKVRMSARAFLIEGAPFEIEKDHLILSFPQGYGFHKEKVEQPENRNAIEKVIKEVTGADLRIKCKFETELSISETGSSETGSSEKALVEKAATLFGGDVIEIKD
jgi:DNA polymerase-3 subunit gamma/tau